MFTTNITTPVKIRVKQPIFEDDFVAAGMLGHLVAVEESAERDMFKLFFDFTEFEEHNKALLEPVYYVNGYTERNHPEAVQRVRDGLQEGVTAIEAGFYEPANYSVYFSCGKNDCSVDEADFQAEIVNFLEIVE